MNERDYLELHDCTVAGVSAVKNRPRNDRVGYLAINSSSSLSFFIRRINSKRFYGQGAIKYLINYYRRVGVNYERIRGIL